MKIKGGDKFREKIPMLSGKKIIFLPLYVIFVLTISIIIQFYFDLLPTILPSEGILGSTRLIFPILGVILIGSLAIFLVYQMWYFRDLLKTKHGALSYQRVFLAGFGGVAVIFSIAIHNFIPFYLWDLGFWSQLPFRLFITPLTYYITPISLALE